MMLPKKPLVQKRLTVEEAHKRAETHYGNAGLASRILTPESMLKLYTYFAGTKDAQSEAFHFYEIGHYAVVKHMVAYLKKNLKVGGLNLTSKEERLVADMLGRVHYNPPGHEYKRKAEAIDKLIKLNHTKAFQIFNELRKEYTRLNLEVVPKFLGKAKNADKKGALGNIFASPLHSGVSGPSGKIRGLPKLKDYFEKEARDEEGHYI